MFYTMGYQGRRLDQLVAAVDESGAVVADIRLSPRSRIPEWRQQAMVSALGDNYHHVPELGNVNYRGGRILIQDPAAGIVRVIRLHERSHVILLCVCRDNSRCHRLTVSGILTSQGHQVTVIPPEQRFIVSSDRLTNHRDSRKSCHGD